MPTFIPVRHPSPFGVIWTVKVGSHSLRVVTADRVGNTAEATIDFTVKKKPLAGVKFQGRVAPDRDGFGRG